MLSWEAVEVEPLDDYQVRVTFYDGLKGIIDMKQLILGGRPGVFIALRDPELFARAYVDSGVICWPVLFDHGVGPLDIAPDSAHAGISRHG
ncbi:DUF2442 domain-containing protein [Geobacter grbiciae]|uniref:DUF2442 domain-containing protein n=1 Tax=Geobacter grbiciae TaxID=155042 RepID=UPI001C01F83A|nr:DUF2442 domain-containing protein [Geobacter grbiciae]MBT1073965.1 DUF2442 domain-containing protein [Geobacter grbiciae]